ncbi:MAG: hypothetical protein ACP6IP_04935 [Candidatus Njordarchaeia archaeon]
MLPDFITYRILMIILTLVIVPILIRAYYKTRYNNYLWLIFSIFFIFMASSFEILGAISPNLEQALYYYYIASIFNSLIYFFATIFLVSNSDEKIKNISLLLISGFLTTELYETFRNPLLVKYENGLWILLQVRSSLAYFSRGLMLIISTLVLTFYMILYIRRTIIKKRKITASIFELVLITIITVDGFYLTFTSLTGQPLNQLLIAAMGLIAVAIVVIIVATDPYLFVFFRGLIKSIFIFRDDGILLSDIYISGNFGQNVSLLANFLSAIAEFGTETIFSHQKLDLIKFQHDVLLIIPYRNVLLAVIGENLGEDLKPLSQSFLKKYYEKFERIINSDILEVPDDKEVRELFLRELGEVIL